MQITMELLLTRLTHEHPDLVILNRGRQGIVEEIRLLPDQAEPLSLLQDTLYVTEHIPPELLTGLHKKTYILCFGPEEEVQEHCSDMTVLRTDRELADLFNAVIKCFHDYMDWQSRIDSVIYREHDFQDLINISEDMLDFPMMVLDPSLKLLAYSKKSLGLNDSIFQKGVQTGYLSPEVISCYQRTHSFDEMRNIEFAVEIPDTFRKREDYAMAVSVGNSLAAFCVMLSTGNYSKAYMGQVFRVFCESVQRMLEWKNRNIQKSRSVVDYFLMDYLNDPEIPPEVLRDRVRLTDLDAAGEYLTATLHPKELKEAVLQNLIASFRSEITNSRVFYYKDHIVILYQLILHQREDYRGNIVRRYGALLRQLHRKEPLFFSRPFQGIEKFPEAYGQAESLYRMFNEKAADSILFYEDYWMGDLFHRNQSRDLLFSYCEPVILDLLEKRTERAENQLRILYAYLNQDRKCSDVADALHMHRNNVVYHIRKLEETYHVDFSEPEIRLRFLLSFALIRQLGIWTESVKVK